MFWINQANKFRWSFCILAVFLSWHMLVKLKFSLVMRWLPLIQPLMIAFEKSSLSTDGKVLQPLRLMFLYDSIFDIFAARQKSFLRQLSCLGNQILSTLSCLHTSWTYLLLVVSNAVWSWLFTVSTCLMTNKRHIYIYGWNTSGSSKEPLNLFSL